MVLDAKANDTIRSNLPSIFDTSRRLSLEGNFDSYFTLYAPSGNKTDALYLFTPDVMQAFVARASDFDVEIVDDTVYMYRSKGFDLQDADSLAQSVCIIGMLRAQLGKQVERYSAASTATPTPLSLEQAQMDEVGSANRLKSRNRLHPMQLLWVFLVPAVVVLLIYTLFRGADSSWVIVLLVITVLIVYIAIATSLYSLYKANRKAR